MKKFLLVCFSFVFVLSAWAQDRVVTGKVTSQEDGSALPGVNVVLKGTTNGTVTDVSGVYTLSVPASGGTLVFSFIGLQSEEVAIGDRNSVDLPMRADVKQLNEVVVTAVGIERDAKSIGYSIATVKNEQINQAKVTNVAAALSGKVSGLQINQVDNGVNGSVRVVLRGNRSLLGNNQALVVLDGVQVSNDYLNSLNPNDIENVTILKGANAAALYGSSAANGVLMITTKVGRSTVPVITVSSTTQIETVSYLPHMQNRFGMNGGETRGSLGNYNIDSNFIAPYTAYENQNYGPEFNGSLQPLGLPLANGRQDSVPYAANKEHNKFWNHAVTTQNDASFSVGDKTSNYYVSFQDVSKKGVVPKDESRRDVLRFNGSKEYGIFKISYKLAYTLSSSNVAYAPSGRGSTVYWMWMNTGLNVPLTQLKDWQNNPYASISGWYDEYYTNPYWQIDNNRQKSQKSDFLGNLELSLQPTKWLNLLGRVGLSTSAQTVKSNNARIEFDPAIVPPGSSRLSTPGTVPAGTSDFFLNTRRINVDFLATIKHSFSDDFNVALILGNNIFDDYGNGVGVSSANLLPFNPTIYNTNYRNGNLSGGSGIGETRRIGVYADFTATYKWASIHGSYRNDWTSLLAANNRSFSYPGVDVAFVLTDAIPALKDNQILSFAKLSGSLAKVGNVSLNPYQLQNVFAAGTPYSANGNVPVLYQGGTAIAANLKPEFTTAKEVTLDMQFWDSKINFKTSFYQSNTTNQTVSINISNTAGYTNALINTGEMLNKGLEFDFSITPVQNSNGFKWTLGANYTQILANKPLSLYTSPTGDVLPSLQLIDNGTNIIGQALTPGNIISTYAIPNQPYPALQGTDWFRDPQGHVIVDATTGLPTRNPALKNFGQTNPKYRLGITNNFTYKAFNLSVLVDYRGGNVIYNQLGADIEFGGLGYQSAAAGRQRFIYPNSVIKQSDGSYTPNTNVTTNDGNINFWTSTYSTAASPYVTSAAFWKLREIALTYTVPKHILEKTKAIKNAKISLTGRNLFMWRPKSNQWTDPEFAGDNSNANGVTTAYQNPPTRIYGANLTLTF